MIYDNIEDQEIYYRIIKTISKVLRVDEDEITANSNYYTDLGADSLDVLRLMMTFEEEFDLHILMEYDDVGNNEMSDDEIEQLKTVSGTFAFIKKKMEEKLSL